ncbi:hypothetical protein KCP78_14805 [Salmonella enterica subsp. enterica]|nr:hypothetical protein KCP78_14805 [Salmonella enterica subsp. enterica]
MRAALRDLVLISAGIFGGSVADAVAVEPLALVTWGKVVLVMVRFWRAENGNEQYLSYQRRGYEVQGR